MRPITWPSAGKLWPRVSLSQGARRNAAEALQALGSQDSRVEAAGNPIHSPIDLSDAAGPGSTDRGDSKLEQWVAVRQQIAQLDSTGLITAVNDEWAAAPEAGALVSAAPGTNYLDACEVSAVEHGPLAVKAKQLARHALNGGTNSRKIIYQEGRSWFSMQTIALPAVKGGAAVIFEDITARRQLELELEHRAFHDPLTGLPNRALLTDRLEHAVAGAARETLALAVLFIDLDEFKSVNDRFGHLAGDATLCEAARRLADCVRTSDTVGRWGGDEFVVIAERLDMSVTADILSRRISERLREPMEIAEQSLEIKATIGVALLEDHESAEDLVEAADRALITARRQRRTGRMARAAGE